MPSVVFAGIDASTEAAKIIMTGDDISEDRTRADTPDSGGGGYFTLSESDSGSNLGTESPHHCIERCNDIYRISKIYSNDDDKPKRMRQISTDYNIDLAADVIGSRPVKPPPRPSGTSSLPSSIPIKSTDKNKPTCARVAAMTTVAQNKS